VRRRSSGEIQADIKGTGGVHFPAGYYGLGQPEAYGQEFSGMWLAVFLAIALIYMLLASQFESFIHL